MGYASSADRSRPGRPAWLPLAASAIVVPTVLAGVTLLWPRPQIEGDLNAAATEALSSAGVPGATLALSGRDATLSGVAGPDAEQALAAVRGVDGIRVAELAAGGTDGTDGGAGAGAGAAAAAPFALTSRGDDIVLTGVVGTEEERAALVAAATAQSGGRPVVDELTVTPGAAPLDAGRVGAATAAVAGIGGDGLTATIDGDTVTLTGAVADDAAKAAAEEAVTAALPGVAVDNQLTVDPSLGGAGAAGELDAAAKAQLQSAIDALIAGAPITFEPNSPQLTPAGADTVAEVLELVTAAPGAALQVDGYVATGPGDGRLTAQELSDQRAATVRDALAAGGVPADRITARGLGEGSTPAAEAAGRRVEITVV